MRVSPYLYIHIVFVCVVARSYNHIRTIAYILSSHLYKCRVIIYIFMYNIYLAAYKKQYSALCKSIIFAVYALTQLFNFGSLRLSRASNVSSDSATIIARLYPSQYT